MDGYAVRWADIAGTGESGPVTLKIAGESQAGIPFDGSLGQGEAVRISTGAMVPGSADTVIRVEDTEETEGRVVVKKCKKQGQDVRKKGEEFGEGDLILPKGLILMARQIALLSAVGMERVPVYDQPKVSLLITGTELAHYGSHEIKPFQVRDSNAPMLQSAVHEAGGKVVECLHVEDNLDATVARLECALAGGSEIILCSGGVSVGRHDHVKEAAVQVGFTELFWKIRQKPGKPLFVAKRGRTLLFGLPEIRFRPSCVSRTSLCQASLPCRGSRCSRRRFPRCPNPLLSTRETGQISSGWISPTNPIPCPLSG